MADNILSAEVAPVKIGHIEIEGLMFSDGSYGVAVPQICDIFQFDKSQASRSIKALMGKDFQFDKVKTKLNPKPVNGIYLPDFELLIVELAITVGNSVAQSFLRSLVGLSLHQLFCDAFGVKFEQDERQEWLKARQEGKDLRRSLTDAIQEYITRNSVKGSEAVWLYKNATDKLNNLLFGVNAKQLREKFECGKDEVRDRMTKQDIIRIRRVEEYSTALIDTQNTHPMKAVNQSYDFWKNVRLPN